MRYFAWVTWSHLGQNSAHTNSSQPSTTDGCTPSPSRAIAASTVEFDARSAAKHPIFPIPYMYPVVSHSVSACQLTKADALSAPS